MATTTVNFEHGAISEEDNRVLENLSDGTYLLTIERHPTPEREPIKRYHGGPMSRDEALEKIRDYASKYVNGTVKVGQFARAIPGAGLLRKLLGA